MPTMTTAHTHASGPDQFACGVFKDHHWGIARHGVTVTSVIDDEVIVEHHLSPVDAQASFNNVVRIWNL